MSLMTDIGTAVKGKLDLVNAKIDTHLSMPTSYHLLNGEVSVSNGIITSGFSTTLYTGNGTTQDVNTGVDMDTQWGNDASEKFGGLVWFKSRSNTLDNNVHDTIRGAGKTLYTNLTNAEGIDGTRLAGFNTTGFTVGSGNGNTNTATYVSWNFQTTHRRTGTTNHGKAFTEHYNPFTGFIMIKYEGSGLAGHEIPHSLGRKLDIAHFKNLSTVQDWLSFYGSANKYLALNLTIASMDASVWTEGNSQSFVFNGGGTQYNQSGSQHIMYGWANSYFDESNKLIGNYEIGVYQGTGAAGNKVKTRGKPAWIMIKRLDGTSDWFIYDNKRLDISGSFDGQLLSNSSAVESATADIINLLSNGFSFNSGAIVINASGGQFLYMVVYDNDNGSGKSKYPKATDSSQLQINALIPFANGIDENGAKNTILSKNETITGLTLTQGKNYVYGKNDGSYGVTATAPKYNIVSTTGDYFDANKNKWFNSSGVEIELSRNYLDAIVYADHNGQIEYVEQLPKTQYVDEIKANEFKGKNTIWGYAIIDCSTTQVTIKGIFGISSVIRIAPGVHRFYFENPVDNLWFGWAYGAINGAGYIANENTRTLNYIDINTFNIGGSNGNNSLLTINFYGGRN